VTEPFNNTNAQKRWESLKNERASWIPHWREVNRFLLPRQGRFMISDTNKGKKNRQNEIYDSAATQAMAVLKAGLLAGMTSPARPWFRLETPDPDLNKRHGVRAWLDDTTRVMQSIFSTSNVYRALRMIYGEVAGFGVSASIYLPRFDTVVHNHPLTIGEYAIACNEYDEVDTLYREFELPVARLVKEYGYENVRPSTRSLFDRGAYEQKITVVHAIEPRVDRDPRRKDAVNMPWASLTFEQGSNPGEYLRKSGFKSFPVLAPRWEALSGDVYGSDCPGFMALGDIKQLQHEQFRKAVGIDNMADPARALPASMRGQEHLLVPGGVVYYEGPTPPQIVSANAAVNLQHLLEDIVDVRGRINRAFHADLFLMLANATDTRMTATEVAERHEEKLLMLGPTIEQLHYELLKPMIDLTFAYMLEAELVPTPPQELSGMELTVNFISMLAQAQRAIATNAIDRYIANVGMIAQMKPDVLDRFNADFWAEAYADMLGVDPDLIVADKEVALIRQARAQQLQQQMAVEQAEQMASAAAQASKVPTATGNLATDIIGQFSGYSSPETRSMEPFPL
jgi:hypothetical protein